VYLSLCFVLLKNVNAQERSVPGFNSRPLISMDFNFELDAGKEDCYFQYVQQDARFYVSFQVLRGGDGMVGFAVQHPDGRMVHPYEVKQTSSYADDKSIGGYYSFCIDNQHSRFASKLVELYISSMKLDGWQKFEKEMEELHLNVQNFTTSINTLEMNTHVMRQFQSHRRSLESRDMTLLSDNNQYVQNWSIAQIVAIVLTCTFQVYFVRGLFDIKTGKIKVQI